MKLVNRMKPMLSTMGLLLCMSEAARANFLEGQNVLLADGSRMIFTEDNPGEDRLSQFNIAAYVGVDFRSRVPKPIRSANPCWISAGYYRMAKDWRVLTTERGDSFRLTPDQPVLHEIGQFLPVSKLYPGMRVWADENTTVLIKDITTEQSRTPRLMLQVALACSPRQPEPYMFNLGGLIVGDIWSQYPERAGQKYGYGSDSYPQWGAYQR